MNLPSTAPVGRGIFFVSVAAVAWGTGGVAAAVLYRTSGLGPLAVSFWRYVCGAAILAGIALARHLLATRRDAGRSTRRAAPVNGARRRWSLLVIMGMGMTVYQTAYFGAVAGAGVAVATVVTLGAGPVLVALGARAIFGERLGPRGVIIVVVALIGLVLLTGGGAAGPDPLLGCALALLSAAGYAGVTLFARATGATGDPGTTALVGFGLGAVCVLPLALLEGLLPHREGLAATAGWVLYLGVVPTALAYTLFFAALAAVRATTAAVVVLLEPVTAAAIAVVALGEHLTPLAVAGTVILLGAVAARARGSAAPRPSASPSSGTLAPSMVGRVEG